MGAIYTKSSASARQYVQAKARITRAQGKAKAIGLLYLLAMVHSISVLRLRRSTSTLLD